MRWVVTVLFAATFAMTMSIGIPGAQAKHKKMCTSTALDGKKVSWKCKRGQKCCFDVIMGSGTCVGKSEVCL